MKQTRMLHSGGAMEVARELFTPYEQLLGRGEDLLLSVPWCAGLVASVGFGAKIKEVPLGYKCRRGDSSDATFSAEEVCAFMECFERYEAHDADYLRAFSACLSVLFSVTPSHLGGASSMLLEVINSTQKEYLAVLANNESMNAGSTDTDRAKNQSFEGYIRFISKMASVALQQHINVHRPGINLCTFNLAISLLPCYQLYAYIGEHLGELVSSFGSCANSNPCKTWLDIYAGKEFQANNKRFERLVNELGRHLVQDHGLKKNELLDSAHGIFARAMQYEFSIFSDFAVHGAPKELDLSQIDNMVAKPPYPKVLIIAGSDSGGGAGIQADIKACEAFGVFSSTAICAITAQNTLGVQGASVVQTDMIRSQMRSVLDDYNDLAVVKTGMLADKATVDAVGDELRSYGSTRAFQLVVDPVIMATSGDVLVDEQAVEAIKRDLLGNCVICTPNRDEAAHLLGVPEAHVYGDDFRDSKQKDESAEQFLREFGCLSVLFKGGHDERIPHSVVDTLYIRLDTTDLDISSELVALNKSLAERGRVDPLDSIRVSHCVQKQEKGFVKIEVEHKRIVRAKGHGSGCTLASSIAACLAHLNNTYPERSLIWKLAHSVVSSVAFVHTAMQHAQGVEIGKGNGPLIHHNERMM